MGVVKAIWNERMLTRVGLVSLLSFTSLVPAVEPDERAAALEKVGKKLLTALGAEPSGCPDLPYGVDAFHANVCGRVDKDARDADRLRSVVDEHLPMSPPSVRPEPFEWKRDGPRHWRSSVVGHEPVLFGFNERSGKMAFIYLMPFASCLPEQKRTPHPAPEGFLTAARVAGTHARPQHPEQARAARVDGMVVLEAEIDREGRVGELCVMDSSRRGYGFEEAAMEAVRQWRYHPAEQDGDAVGSSMTVWLKFEIR